MLNNTLDLYEETVRLLQTIGWILLASPMLILASTSIVPCLICLVVPLAVTTQRSFTANHMNSTGPQEVQGRHHRDRLPMGKGDMLRGSAGKEQPWIPYSQPTCLPPRPRENRFVRHSSGIGLYVVLHMYMCRSTV